MERTLEAGIPMDVQWNDIDYMRNRNGFTLDEKNYATLPQFVDAIHKVRIIMVSIHRLCVWHFLHWYLAFFFLSCSEPSGLNDD